MVAPSSSAICDHLGHELDVRARAVLGRELDVVGVVRCACATAARDLALDVLARGLQLALEVDVGGGDEGVDARPLGVPHRVPGRVDVLLGGPRQPADDRALHLPRDRLHGLEVAGRGDRKPASITSTPSRASWWAISSFSCLFSDMPGDCSPSRSVVSKIRTRFARVPCWLRLCRSCRHAPFSVSLDASSPLGLRLRGRHALFPPRGEQKSKGENQRTASAAQISTEPAAEAASRTV